MRQVGSYPTKRQDLSKYVIFDVEANGYLNEATVIWVIVSKSHDGTIYYSTYDDRQEECEATWISREDHLFELWSTNNLVGHNIFTFDIPLIEKIYPNYQFNREDLNDTFIQSSLFRPDRTGGHSVDAYGEEYEDEKIDFHDFHEYSKEMLIYCIQDVQIQEQIYKDLLNDRLEHNWEEAINTEYGIATVHSEQVLHGVLFNQELAFEITDEILTKKQEITTKLIERVNPKIIQLGETVTKPFKLNGELTTRVISYMADQSAYVGGPFSKVDFIPFNPYSPVQQKEALFAEGWEPDEWNTKKDKNGRMLYDEDGEPLRASPKVTESSLASLTTDTGKLLADFNILTHRGRLLFNIRKKDLKLTGLLNLVRADGRISADGIPQGTPTGRYRHIGVVNIPKAKKKIPYGEKIRSLFIVPKRYVMLGVDAVSLEANIEGHYVYPFPGGPEYVSLLLSKEEGKGIHDRNALLIQRDRDTAKSFKYALTYGCQVKKLSTILKCDIEEAQTLYDNFWDGNVPLAMLKEKVASIITKRGYLLGLDGRKLFSRSPHSAVNLLFQSGGSIVVKRATIIMRDKVRKANLDAHQVLHFHDEFQYEVLKDHAEHSKQLALDSFSESGLYYNLNVPIQGDPKIGSNWAETH